MDTRSQKLRSFFLHLLALIAVWTLVITSLTVIMTGINLWYPDVASDYYWSNEGFVQTLRIAASFLIVTLPVTLITYRQIRKTELTQAEGAHISIRVLEYITLLAAGLTVLGRLVYQINDFLGGEYAPRSIWKTVAIVVILGIVTVHYWGRINLPTWYTAKTRAIIRWVTIVGALVCLVVGIAAAGSPMKARNIKLDQNREQDLQSIYSQLETYVFMYNRPYYGTEPATTVKALPADINEIFNTGDYYPEFRYSLNEYKYTKQSDTKAQLCTTFASDRREDNGRIQIGAGGSVGKDMAISYPYPEYRSRFQQHPVGNHCFNLTVNTEFRRIDVQ